MKKKPKIEVDHKAHIDHLLWLMSSSVSNQLEKIVKIQAAMGVTKDWPLAIMAELDGIAEKKATTTFLEAGKELYKYAAKIRKNDSTIA